jgi:hypothetical protein
MGISYSDVVKKPFVEHEYTVEQVQELGKCAEDIWHFLKYIKIVHPDRGRIRFAPYDYQKKILRMFQKFRFICGLWSRQSGKSTTVAIYALWFSIFNADKTIGIASNKQNSAVDILNRIKLMYEELPDWIKPGVREYSKTFITFDNGSRIIVSATSEDAFRGRTLNLLIMDEFAFVRKNIAEAFWASNYPTISASVDAKICIISTPNGIFNLFHQIYSQAEREENAFKYIRSTWRDVPGRDDEWAAEQLRNLGRTRFNQEFAVEFLGSTNTLIDTIVLETLFTKYSDTYASELGDKLKVYEKPTVGAKYILGVDTATGAGEDFSAIQVLKIINLVPVKCKEVAVYHNNLIDVYNFAEVVHRLSIYYNQAYIMCENNAEGAVVVNNLWWEMENAGLVNSGTKSKDLGMRATRKSKPTYVLYMKRVIESGQLELIDKDTIDELGAFIEENGKFHGKDVNDDLVCALYWSVAIFQMDVLDESAVLKVRNNVDDEDDAWGLLSDSYEYVDDFSWLIRDGKS